MGILEYQHVVTIRANMQVKDCQALSAHKFKLAGGTISTSARNRLAIYVP